MNKLAIQMTARWFALGLMVCLALPATAQQAGGGGARRGSSGASRTYPQTGAIGDAYFSIDPETRRVVTIADEETSKYISQVISNLDRPKPQVLIKVVFLEVTHNDSLDLGIEGTFTKGFGNPYYTGGVTTNLVPGPGGTNLSTIFSPAMKQPTVGGVQAFNFPTSGAQGVYTVLGQDYTVTLHAIAAAGNGKILSRPSILARNNQPATITVGQSVPLITSVRYDSLGNAINAVTYKDVGVILRVTPFITPDNMVEMIVSPEISNIDNSQTVPISQGVAAPIIDIRSADTVAVTPDGQTVVIGGLMQTVKAKVDTKIPFLGDIPVLGFLFKRTQRTETQKELIIFLTPHIVQAPTELAALSNRELNKSDAPKDFTEQELNKYLEKIPMKEPGTDSNGDKKPVKK
jgi:general secretion pathway protein D